PRRRSGGHDAAAGHRPPAPHSHDRAGSQGDPHQPPGARAHHDRGHGHQRGRHRVPHGRGAPSAPARPALAVSDRRGGPPAHPPGRRGQAALDAGGERRAALGVGVMLRITGGKVYDPANRIEGEVRDVAIADGRIVAQAAPGRTIDATGMVVLPGGVDAHTHVAGAGLNFARAMTPELQRKGQPFLHTPERRMGLGGLTPTTFATGYLYAGMGYTTITEAAVPVLSAKHTHEELHDTPILDKACLLLMANNEIVLDLLEAGETERAAQVVAWLIWSAKTYGVKA